MIRRIIIINFLIITVLASLPASETKDGFIRLLLNERNGSFSFLYLDSQTNNYAPLLSRHSSPTSYLTVNVNGRSYQLGKSGAFKIKVDKTNGDPAIIYESSFLLIKQVITPVKTSGSPNANGIKITVNIENKDGKDATVGLRLLLDTYLGEGRRRIPFVTDNQEIITETIVKKDSGENYWISRRDDLSLMGSIINPFNEDSKQPDYLHFANWKKLNDVPWNAQYRPGRSFNSIPYSIGDSAVCYYYEPDMLAGGASFKYTVYLTTEDTQWYASLHTVADNEIIYIESPAIDVAVIEENSIVEAAIKNEDSDILTLMKLHEIITQFLAGDILLNEQDLLEIEMSINKVGHN